MMGTFNIAILTSGFNYVSAQIKDSFIQTIRASNTEHSYSYKIFDSENKSNLLYAHLRDIMHGHYDLIFSIGSPSTRAALDTTLLNDKIIPIVFGCVANPVEQGFIDSIANSGNHLTGVSTVSHNHQEQLFTLLKLKPDLKKVIIAYDPGQESSRQQMMSAKKAFESQAIQVLCIQIMHRNDIIIEIQPHLADADILFTLRDHVARQHMSLLAKLCNYFGVTLVASDLESVRFGAAVGFGQPADATGVQAAQKARLILEKKTLPCTIPVQMPDAPYKVFLNRSAVKTQNMVIDPHLISLMHSSELV